MKLINRTLLFKLEIHSFIKAHCSSKFKLFGKKVLVIFCWMKMKGTFIFFPNFFNQLRFRIIMDFYNFQDPFWIRSPFISYLVLFHIYKGRKKIFKIFFFWNSENMKINSIFHIFSWGSKTKVRKVSDMFLEIYIDSFHLQFFQLSNTLIQWNVH